VPSTTKSSEIIRITSDLVEDVKDPGAHFIGVTQPHPANCGPADGGGGQPKPLLHTFHGPRPRSYSLGVQKRLRFISSLQQDFSTANFARHRCVGEFVWNDEANWNGPRTRRSRHRRLDGQADRSSGGNGIRHRRRGVSAPRRQMPAAFMALTGSHTVSTTSISRPLRALFTLRSGSRHHRL